VGAPAACARGRSGGRHCTADQSCYVPLGRHLVSWHTFPVLSLLLCLELECNNGLYSTADNRRHLQLSRPTNTSALAGVHFFVVNERVCDSSRSPLSVYSELWPVITGPPNGQVLFCWRASVVCRRRLSSSVTLPAGRPAGSHPRGTLPEGGPAGRRARGRSGGRHCTAGHYGCVPLERHLVSLQSPDTLKWTLYLWLNIRLHWLLQKSTNVQSLWIWNVRINVIVYDEISSKEFPFSNCNSISLRVYRQSYKKPTTRRTRLWVRGQWPSITLRIRRLLLTARVVNEYSRPVSMRTVTGQWAMSVVNCL